MMGVASFSEEHTSPIFPSRIFNAWIVDSHSLIPKLMPQVTKSMEIIEGDGGAGSVKLINFTQGSNFESVKDLIDELNEDTLTLVIRFEKPPDDGSISKIISKYYTEGDFKFEDEVIKAVIPKAGEAYLLQNPESYG